MPDGVSTLHGLEAEEGDQQLLQSILEKRGEGSNAGVGEVSVRRG